MKADSFPVWPGWETVKLIGRGSYGAVYEIEQDVLGEKEKAALKVITIPQSDSDIQAMFNDGYDEESVTETLREQLKSILAEYTLTRKMNGHSNVVNCEDLRCEQHADGFGWDVFIKMELLTPLAAALPAVVPEEQAVRIAKDMCQALILCARHSIIHRDIKPQNIFLSKNGDYKLGDFGVAKTVEATVGGTKIGTYDYMAPEVYRALPYGGSVDIYSLGMVLYWLLNERRGPFLPLPPDKPTLTMKEEARRRRFDGEALPAPAHGGEELQRIVLKACAFDPKDRYRSAEEMLRDLEALDAPVRTYVPAEELPEPDGTVVPAPAGEDAAETLGALYTGEDTTGSGTRGAFSAKPAPEQKPKTAVPQPESEDTAETAAPEPDGEDAAEAADVFYTGEDTTGTATVGAFHAKPAPGPTPSKARGPKPPRSKSRLPLILGLAAGLLALLVIGLFAVRALIPAKSARPETAIANFAYYDRDDLTSIAIPDGVTRIDHSAFASCSNLTSVTIPDSVVSIGSNVFQDCEKLQSITIPSSVTSIGSCAFNRCTSLTGVTIPNSVTSLGMQAFGYCSSLASVTIPDSVTGLSNGLFWGCSSLKTVTIPNSVVSIGSNAFYGCKSLTGISIPNSVTSIGDSAFMFCSSLSGVTIPSGVTSIGEKAFYGCESLTSITIPSSVTSLGSGAFTSCDSLTSVMIPNSVTSLGSEVFMYCKSLKSVTIPDSVTGIGEKAFDGCGSLESVTIGSGVTSIGEKAFFGCKSLKSLTIPSSVTSIGAYLFDPFDSLTDVYYGGSEAQWAAISFGTGNQLLHRATIHYNSK